MPYPKDHKSKTRVRIIRSATRLFGERNYADVSIDDVMRSAGLTRGAFYGHFESKQALCLHGGSEVYRGGV